MALWWGRLQDHLERLKSGSLTRSSPTGPAEQEEGGSLDRGKTVSKKKKIQTIVARAIIVEYPRHQARDALKEDVVDPASSAPPNRLG